ncbi:Down syndrome cell adhesion molecule-like protein Dscam2, partial [Rhagoletis pomonella]|uniref:Down syndrome cell adhesion molecule-like protein Dscam2 n=1 Tax=Rhagoletis pomonella TaxID=28610 RepID=UPI001784B0B7
MKGAGSTESKQPWDDTNDALYLQHLKNQVSDEDDTKEKVERKVACADKVPMFEDNELKGVLKNKTKRSAGGCDQITYEMLRSLPETATKNLLTALNDAFAKCEINDSWRKVRIVPIPKANKDLSDYKNFRPIPLISVLVKSINLMIKGRLEGFLNDKNIYPERSYAYRKGKSAAMCINDFLHKVASLKHAGKKALVLTLDISNAYNCVTLGKLQSLLGNFEIPDTYIKWIIDFFGKRILHLGKESIIIEDGLPQGSCLSPLLFNLYTKELHSIGDSGTDIYQFADDFLILSHGSNCDMVRQNLEQKAKQFYDICTKLNLSFNIQKTKLMCIAKSNRQDVQIKINEIPIEQFQIPDNSRFLVGQYVTIHDDVISHVNISNVKEEDGGEYACTARNAIGKVSHSAKVNIYGLPFIREMPKITGISGSDLVVKCPVAGYPIDKIHWERDGQTLPINRRQRAYNNGTLIIEQLQRLEDAGTYTCMAQNKQKQTSRRNVEIQVLVPPKIMPIQAMTNMLREGMRAAISCQILEGDLPVSFRWERNDKPLIGTGNEVFRRLDEYSASLVIEHITSEHSGNYSCIASNVAGMERFTVPLTVNVPPKWVLEPKDSSAQAGQDVWLHCQSSGYPKPAITWKKAIGPTPGEYKDFLYEPTVQLFPNGTIFFKKISKESQGHFLCESKNNIGSGVSKVIFLKVNVPAHFQTKTKQISVAKGKQVHVQCNVQGDNPIDIKWKIQATQQYLDESLDSRYTIRDQVLDDGMVSELGISHTYRQDTGIYICQASNAFGQDEMSIQLIVQEVPEQPKNLRINSQQSRSLQLTWSQPFAGNSPIDGYHIYYKQISDIWQNAEHITITGGQTVVNIQSLRPAKAYHIRMSAENKLGASEYSEVVQVTTLEEVPSGPPLNVRAEARSSTEISVTWDAPDRDYWNGILLGYYVGYQMSLSPEDKEVNPTQGFSFKTVEVRSHFGGETVLSNLNKFTQYHIIVQAYTSQGSGPPSREIAVQTMEDVPSSPPESPQCDVLGSTSIYITWSPPDVDGQNGKIKGYKVFYISVNELYETDPEVVKSTNQYVTVENLRKYTNYTVWVIAYTKVGDGMKTKPFYCRTHEDVPSAPQAIKAIPASSTKIIVSWLPPEFPNGDIIGYTFYMSMLEGGREEGTHKRILGPFVEMHETQRTQESATYQFWLTAATKIGEGEKTQVVTVPPNNKVPARIVSFSQRIISPWKEHIELPCRKVGSPAPVTIWRQDGHNMDTNARKVIAKNGTLYIRECQAIDAGNYTCSVENTWGKDEIVYNIVIKVPPDAPNLTVVNSYTDSLHLEWMDNSHGGSPILGYVINYKRENGDWEELQVDAKTNSHLLSNLWCGTRYQLYITAYNKIGTGLPCDIVNSYTKGNPPVQPKHSQMITNNSTSVTCWLDSWGDGGCGILYFMIESRMFGRSQWNVVSNHIPPTERIYTVSDLVPGTKYQLKVTSHNNAGSTTAVYNFTTLSP